MFEKFLGFVKKHTKRIPKIMGGQATSIVVNLGFVGLVIALIFGRINDRSSYFIKQSANIQASALIYTIVLVIIYYIPIIRLIFPIALIAYRIALLVMIVMGIIYAAEQNQKKGVWFVISVF